MNITPGTTSVGAKYYKYKALTVNVSSCSKHINPLSVFTMNQKKRLDFFSPLVKPSVNDFMAKPIS